MADQRIDDLTYDPAGSNVARDDLVLIQRNNVDYKANFAGALLLPDFTTADRNKTLQINPAGTAATWTESNRKNWNLALTQTRSQGNSQPFSPIITSNSLGQYRDFYAIFTLSGGSQYGIEIRRGVPTNISSDGNVKAWFSNNYTHINFEVGGSSLNINSMHLYGRL